MTLTDYTDNTKLTLSEKPCKGSDTKVYLSHNLRFQLLEYGSGRYRGQTASIEQLFYYGKMSWVLRIKNKHNTYTLVLNQENKQLLDTYLKGESDEINTTN